MKQSIKIHKHHLIQGIKIFFWFGMGAILGLFFFISFVFILFQQKYANTVYPGVTIGGVQFGGKTQQEVSSYFYQKNQAILQSSFTFTLGSEVATVSAKDLDLGYDSAILAKQAYEMGRSEDLLANISLIIQAYTEGLNLQSSYHYTDSVLENALKKVESTIKLEPVEALFRFENGKVVTFRPSIDGQEIDMYSVREILKTKVPSIVREGKAQTITIGIPVRVVKPKVTTEKANNLGIKELIGSGTSVFPGSVESRIYNVNLASSRMNGILVEPGQVFSFVDAIGDVSKFTGYKQAYIIENGRTVLGDGGGVCQVSTTLFRALLNAGLTIVERNAHAYRVRYYEYDSAPGFDATVYIPGVDLKFKNDTANYILIQNVVDQAEQRLTFYLYGTKDNREVTISTPKIVSRTLAPEALYQDDPNLPKGTIKQIDYAAEGAKVTFTREVKKDGQVHISETFVSNFRPWQAVFLRGTKE